MSPQSRRTGSTFRQSGRRRVSIGGINWSIAAQYTTGMGLGGGALMGGWRGALLRGWASEFQLNVGSGLPLTPCLLCGCKRDRGDGKPEARCYGSFGYGCAAGIVLESRRIPLAGRRAMGECWTQFDHRPFAVQPEFVAPPQFPLARPLQLRTPRRCYEPAEPCHRKELERDRGQRSVRPADSR